MFSFLHRPWDLNMLSSATGINLVFSACAFLSLKVPVAIDLHSINHQWTRFQLKIFFTVLLKKKVTYISANVHFWVNYPFNGTAISDLQTARACRCRLSVCRGWARANRSRSPHSRTERWADSEDLLEQTQKHRLSHISHILLVSCYMDTIGKSVIRSVFIILILISSESVSG